MSLVANRALRYKHWNWIGALTLFVLVALAPKLQAQTETDRQGNPAYPGDNRPYDSQSQAQPQNPDQNYSDMPQYAPNAWGDGTQDQQNTIPLAPTDTVGPYSPSRPVQGSYPPGTLPTRNGQRQQRPATLVPPPVPVTEFQRLVRESTGRLLPIFGADMFNAPPSTFAPVDNIPIAPDYIVGPGDELRVQIWGQVNLRGSYIVDRTGSIALPQVGTIHVAGLRFSQLSDFLKSQLGRVYRNYDLNVNLGQLRSIQVFVVGKVKQPGSYTVGSMSTLLNALFASGGPQPLGSLRDIQLKRNGETITHFDLYDLLGHGDKSKDAPLLSGDVIFVPDVGPQAAVVGSVKTPGIYELRDEQTFQQLLSLAGGQTNVAAGKKARVERVLNHSERNVIDVDLAVNDLPPVQDGDVMVVNSIVDRFNNSVTLRGNVANPGRYAWQPGMHIADLIPNRDMLVTRNYDRRQSLLGQSDSDYLGPSNTDYAGTAGEGALGVQAGAGPTRSSDARSSQSSGGANSIGAALTVGTSGFAPKTDVILSAPDIDWDYAVVERKNAGDLTTTLLPFGLGKLVLDKDQGQNLELQSGDVITIFSKADIRVPSSHQTKFVRLEGEFLASGIYSVQPGEKLRQLLARAGGLTPDAYLFASEFTRESVRRLQRQRLHDYADSLESEITTQTSAAIAGSFNDRDAAAAQASAVEARAALQRLRQTEPTGRVVLQLAPDSQGVATVPDLELEDGDRFVVPKTPSSVNVVGQVYSANAFVFQPNRRVRDYLHLAGGPSRMADRKRAFILRADGSVLSYQYATARHYGTFDRIIVLPGDTIVVPPQIEKGAKLREVANIAAILQGFGIAAAAIQVLK